MNGYLQSTQHQITDTVSGLVINVEELGSSLAETTGGNCNQRAAAVNCADELKPISEARSAKLLDDLVALQWAKTVTICGYNT